MMGSEVGTLAIAPENVERRGRLQPGRTFFLDLEGGRIIEDEELEERYIRRQPYRQWVEARGSRRRARDQSLPRARDEPAADRRRQHSASQ